jgi:protein-disulfide isomerase
LGQYALDSGRAAGLRFLAPFVFLIVLRGGGERSRFRGARAGVAVVTFGICLGIAYTHPSAVPLWVAATCAFTILILDTRLDPDEGAAASVLGRSLRDTIRDPGMRRRLAIGALSVVVVAQFLSSRAAGVGRGGAEQLQLIRWYRATSGSAIPALRATSDADHRIVVFSDYQCPFCRIQVPQYRTIVHGARSRGVRVSFEVRDFPLASECNPMATTTIHPLACDMAVAARLVRQAQPERAEEFDRWLLAQPESIAASDLLTKLEAIQLGGEFNTTRARWLAAVKEDATFGSQLGVFSTPTVFVDGVRLPSITPLGLQALIDSFATTPTGQ